MSFISVTLLQKKTLFKNVQPFSLCSLKNNLWAANMREKCPWIGMKILSNLLSQTDLKLKKGRSKRSSMSFLASLHTHIKGSNHPLILHSSECIRVTKSYGIVQDYYYYYWNITTNIKHSDNKTIFHSPVAFSNWNSYIWKWRSLL